MSGTFRHAVQLNEALKMYQHNALCASTRNVYGSGTDLQAVFVQSMGCHLQGSYLM